MRVPDALTFEQVTSHAGVRVKITGELDVATAPLLEARLVELRAAGLRVHLDLSELTFIDVAGARALKKVVAQSEPDGRLHLEPWPPPQARRLLELLEVGHLARAA